MGLRSLSCSLAVLLAAAPASADTDTDAGRGNAEPAAPHLECREVLSKLGVPFSRTHRRGIADAVIIDGEVGGVTYRAYAKKRKLVIDCSLAVSLALAAPYFAAAGVTRVRYSSAYDRRFIRGTHRLSHHSFGLAIDVHTFSGDSIDTLTVRDDYEQGLGDDIDCVGRPLTQGGLILRRISCQLARSELFRIVLDPDYDADHYNHFHLEARPWDKRTDHALLAERLERK